MIDQSILKGFKSLIDPIRLDEMSRFSLSLVAFYAEQIAYVPAPTRITTFKDPHCCSLNGSVRLAFTAPFGKF